MHQPTASDQTIRLSLTGVLIALAFIILIGIVGGALGQYLFGAPGTPLISPQEQIVTTKQEVVVSPSKAAADVVQNSERSVMALVSDTSAPGVVIGSGLVVTNDGLLVVPQTALPPVAALDRQGTRTLLEKVGDDRMYGLSYYRLQSGVFVPLEIEAAPARVAASLLALSRQPDTLQSRSAAYAVQEYALPAAGLSPAIQRVFRSAPLAGEGWLGGTLLNDDGHVAGLLINPGQGLALSAVDLQRSIDRVIQRSIEDDSLETAGLAVRYVFAQSSPDEPRQFSPTVTAVRPGSPAAVAGIQVGDSITSVSDTPVTWEGSLAQLLSRPFPLQVHLTRDGEERTVTLNEPAPA